MTTDNDALKQVTADDIGGFVNTVVALWQHAKLREAVKKQLDEVLMEIGNDLDGAIITEPDTMNRWLSAALIGTEEAQPEAAAPHSQRAEQYQSDRVTGFVDMLLFLFARPDLGRDTKDDLARAIGDIGCELKTENLPISEAVRIWITGAPVDEQEAVHKQTTTDPQRHALRTECELFKVARMHTEWEDLADEGSILLKAVLANEPIDEIHLWLDFLARCSFMCTSEFSKAFEAYSKQVLDWNQGGEADES